MCCVLLACCLSPCSLQQALVTASKGRWGVLLVSDPFPQGNLLGRHSMVSLAKSSPLLAVSGGPQTMPSAGLWKNVTVLKPMIPQEALLSCVPPCYQRSDLGLGTVPCSSHSPHTTRHFGCALWTLTCMTPKDLATFPIHADHAVSTPKLWECWQEGQAEGNGRWVCLELRTWLQPRAWKWISQGRG